MGNKYVIGETYEQGKYIGIVDTYPWNENYFIRNHHFAIMPEGGTKTGGNVAQINKVFIAKIKREDK